MTFIFTNTIPEKYKCQAFISLVWLIKGIVVITEITVSTSSETDDPFLSSPCGKKPSILIFLSRAISLYRGPYYFKQKHYLSVSREAAFPGQEDAYSYMHRWRQEGVWWRKLLGVGLTELGDSEGNRNRLLLLTHYLIQMNWWHFWSLRSHGAELSTPSDNKIHQLWGLGSLRL